MSNPFTETRNLYINFTGYVKPLSYSEWMDLPHSHKAAVLFVQYFEEITLAWYKTKSFYALDEDGVSCIGQYLEKNVPIIENDEKRFSSAYIYKVAYNCLYCICHDIKRDKERWENEISNIVETGEDTLDLFDTAVSDTGSAESVAFTSKQKSDFWNIIEEMGPEAEKVVYHLINGEGLGKLSSRSKNKDIDPLADVKVSLDQMESIISDLRIKLAQYNQ